MLGGEALVVGTEGLGGEVDFKAIDSLRDLCANLPGTSPSVEGGEGEDSLDLLAGLSPPLWLCADETGVQVNDVTTGAPLGDAWDPNDHTFASLVVGPDAQGDSLGLPSPLKIGRADPVLVGEDILLLDDLHDIIENGIPDNKNGNSDETVVDKLPPGKDEEDGIAPGTNSANVPPSPPLDDKREGGTTPENDEAQKRNYGRGGKKRKASEFKPGGEPLAETETVSPPRKVPTLSTPPKFFRAFKSNPREYWNAPVSTNESAKTWVDEAEAQIAAQKRELETAKTLLDEAEAQIAAQKRKVETTDGKWWAPGIQAKE
jgi:hypothetical protein